MTMPPFAQNPEESRRWFAALRALADERGLRRLSMGTSQDYRVAVAGGRDYRANRHETVRSVGIAAVPATADG